jgi:hypothetical protein
MEEETNHLRAEEEARAKAEAEAMAAYERVETLSAQVNLNELVFPVTLPAEKVEFQPEAEAEAEAVEFVSPVAEARVAADAEAEAKAQAEAEAAAQEQARQELQRRLQEEVERRQVAENEMARLLAEEEAARQKEEIEAASRWNAVHAAAPEMAEEIVVEELVLEETAEETPVAAPEGWSEYDSEFVLAPLPEGDVEVTPAAEAVSQEDLTLLPEVEAEEVAAEPVAVYEAPVLTPVFTPSAEGDEAIPAELLADLQSEQSEARAGATLALSRLGLEGDEAFGVICRMFDDPIQSVRDAAARALYNLSRDRAATFTRALREADTERRRGIGASMSSSGLADEAISNLVDESREKTYDAFSFLFLMSKAGEVQPLVKAIKDHPSKDVRLAVVRLLALSGQPEVLPAFRRLAVRGSLPTEVRSAVMEAIFQISSQNASDNSAQVN